MIGTCKHCGYERPLIDSECIDCNPLKFDTIQAFSINPQENETDIYSDYYNQLDTYKPGKLFYQLCEPSKIEIDI